MYIGSAIIYIAYGVLSVGTAYVAEYNRDKRLAILSFMICVLFWGVRYGIGFDYENYVKIYEDIKVNGGFLVEPGWYALNFLFSRIPNGEVLVMMSASAITFAFMFLAFWRRRILWQGLFFSLVFQFQFMAANQVRQAMGIAIFLFILKYIEERRWIRYVLWVVLSSVLVHVSAIILLLAIPLSFIKVNKYAGVTLLAIVYLGYLLGKFTSLGNTVLFLLPIPEKYSLYLLTDRVFSEEVGFSIVQLVNVAVVGVLLWNKRVIKNEIAVTLMFTGSLMYMMFIEYHLLLRMSFYFLYMNIIVASLFVKKTAWRGQLLVTIMSFFFVMVCLQSDNMHGVLPYSSIFSK